jgi:hypothetical protein
MFNIQMILLLNHLEIFNYVPGMQKLSQNSALISFYSMINNVNPHCLCVIRLSDNLKSFIVYSKAKKAQGVIYVNIYYQIITK